MENETGYPLIIYNVKINNLKTIFTNKKKMSWIQNDFGNRKPMANYMIEPRSIQSQWFPMLASITTRPQQHMSMHDETQ